MISVRGSCRGRYKAFYTSVKITADAGCYKGNGKNTFHAPERSRNKAVPKGYASDFTDKQDGTELFSL